MYLNWVVHLPWPWSPNLKTSDCRCHKSTIKVHRNLPGSLLCCAYAGKNFVICLLFFHCGLHKAQSRHSLEDMQPISLCFDMTPGAVWLVCRLLGEAGVSSTAPCSPGVSGAWHTHGSTLELHYTAIGPITIITALKPQQFVSGMHQRNHQAFGPAEQRPPPLSLSTHFPLSVFHSLISFS